MVEARLWSKTCIPWNPAKLDQRPESCFFPSGKKLLDVDILFLVLAEAQQVERPEAENIGDENFGKLLDGDVVDVHGFVIELAAVGNGIFQPGDAADQMLKRLHGLEFRIRFHGGVDAS